MQLFKNIFSHLKIVFFSFFILCIYNLSFACQCPPSVLNYEECVKYDLIFKGKIKSIKKCNHNLGEAVFEIDELYRGNATKHFTVLFNCEEECSIQLNVGEEWIIHTNYKQINNALLNWCSRSRKHFVNLQEDYYYVNYGKTFDEDLSFLRTEFGLHRLIDNETNNSPERNIKPSVNQSILMLLVSIAGLVVFYFIINRFFKSK
ncbi:MAG: hypothetical protein LCH32_10415 [Bacteroidetes bacterium]|nr:hypothetical protein [Bacteroidota bacterium]